LFLAALTAVVLAVVGTVLFLGYLVVRGVTRLLFSR
jgi:hypothetical protein